VKKLRYQHKTVMHKDVKNLAINLGLDIRIAPSLIEAKIRGGKLGKGEIACYVGGGVIWLRDTMPYDKHDQQLVILHEVGHAIMDYFFNRRSKTHITRKMHELKANAAAVTIASLLRLPMSVRIIKDFAKFTKVKGIRL